MFDQVLLVTQCRNWGDVIIITEEYGLSEQSIAGLEMLQKWKQKENMKEALQGRIGLQFLTENCRNGDETGREEDSESKVPMLNVVRAKQWKESTCRKEV